MKSIINILKNIIKYAIITMGWLIVLLFFLLWLFPSDNTKNNVVQNDSQPTLEIKAINLLELSTVTPIPNFTNTPIMPSETSTLIIIINTPTNTPFIMPTSTLSPEVINAPEIIAEKSDEECDIKGNVNSKGERIYHFSWCPSYERTKIKPEEGDKWFCSGETAELEGFRLPENCK